jgi:uncharacterized membrane protein
MVTTSIMLVFALAILTPPILCHIIARIDNRKSIRWFLYGLFFGIFALIYLLFYTYEGDEDRINPRVMGLLCILMLLMLIALYKTFFG